MLKLNKLFENLRTKIFLLVFLIIVALAYLFLQHSIPNSLRINEVAFSNSDRIDWIEIYNPTMNNLSLEGLYLSDNANNFSKFKIEQQIVVPSRGYIVIYCDGYDDTTGEAIITNFRISNGETVYLVARDGSSVIDSLTAINDSAVTVDTTTGRFPDGSDEIFMMSNHSPGSANQKDMLNNMKGMEDLPMSSGPTKQ
jgi:hypothetical protein